MRKPWLSHWPGFWYVTVPPGPITTDRSLSPGVPAAGWAGALPSPEAGWAPLASADGEGVPAPPALPGVPGAAGVPGVDDPPEAT